MFCCVWGIINTALHFLFVLSDPGLFLSFTTCDLTLLSLLTVHTIPSRLLTQGLGTDEDTLIEILASRTNKEIREIKKVYKGGVSAICKYVYVNVLYVIFTTNQ